jgi:TetR/AcrR family fatty acid metabolism transcriptional regulator
MAPSVARKIIFGSLDEVATCWVLSARSYDLTELTVPVYDVIARGLSADGMAPPFPAAATAVH